MKKSCVEVAPVPGGWEVRGSAVGKSSKFYTSKLQAVLDAWAVAAPGTEVIIRASTGEILRLPEVKPSGNRELMLAAVIEAVRRKEAEESR